MFTVHSKNEQITGVLSTIKREMQDFEQTVNNLDNRYAVTKNLPENEIEKTHSIVSDEYNRLQGQLEKVRELCCATQDLFQASQISENNIPHFYEATDLEHRIFKVFGKFNDTIRSFYPLAPIQQSPRVSPKALMDDLLKSDKDIMKYANQFAQFSSYRKISGDGNCFYTSFAVRYLEEIMGSKALFDKFLTFVCSSIEGEESAPLKQHVINTALYMNEYPSQLETVLRDNNRILPIVRYFRELVSVEMLKNPRNYQDAFTITLLGDFEEDPSIAGKDYAQLVNDYVRRMGVDATHVPMTILCKKLNFPCRIHSPQRYSVPINTIEDREPIAQFIRLGAHYFVAYPKTGNDLASSPIPSETTKPSYLDTKVTVRCQVPFGHSLFIRTNAGGLLSWKNKGIPLRQTDKDLWEISLFAPTNEALEYKILFDDETWEKGPNRKLTAGTPSLSEPHFILSPQQTKEVVLEAPPAPVKTKIVVRYDVGFGNNLYLRGKGAPGLDWVTGVKMTCTKPPNLWTWECDSASIDPSNFKYKVLINNRIWEKGVDHEAKPGENTEVIPNF